MSASTPLRHNLLRSKPVGIGGADRVFASYLPGTKTVTICSGQAWGKSVTGISVWDIREDGTIVGTYRNEHDCELCLTTLILDVIFLIVLNSRKARPLLDDGRKNRVRESVPGMPSGGILQVSHSRSGEYRNHTCVTDEANILSRP